MSFLPSRKIKENEMPRNLDDPLVVEPSSGRNIFGPGGLMESHIDYAPKQVAQINPLSRLDSIAMTVRALTYDEMMEWDVALRGMMALPTEPMKEGEYAALFSRWAKEQTMAGLAEGMKENKTGSEYGEDN